MSSLGVLISNQSGREGANQDKRTPVTLLLRFGITRKKIITAASLGSELCGVKWLLTQSSCAQADDSVADPKHKHRGPNTFFERTIKTDKVQICLVRCLPRNAQRDLPSRYNLPS